ncbi:MAG TPA: hypothetical protein VHK67_00645 [Rhabdochlamydiaceae bacterium]|jgi:hypothetical protein|nr:hypothetical protein [Rhabdochlamydiaceae bacterium]
MKYRELLEKIQNALREEKPSEAQHSYVQTTALRVPKNLPKQPLPAKPAIRKTDVVTKEWNKEVQQTASCSSHIEPEMLPGAHLIPARVHRWNIKNYASIARKMQMVVKTPEKELSDNISVIPTSDDQTAKKNQDDLLLEMMKRREERQFRIEKPLC